MLRVANVVQLKARRLMPALVLQALAAGCIVFAIYIAVWSIWVAPDYYPRGDNFSVLVNSLPEFHPKISDWFFQGFRTYFHVYPDMSKNGTNFIRPGVNVTFFMEWFIFHRHWERYLLFTYATVAALAGMVYYTARSFFFVSPRLALLAALAVGFAPSIDTNALWDPTFGFDLLAGALVLAGILALLRSQTKLAWALLSYAMFTKETALFAPLFAALILLLRKNTRLRSRILQAAFFVTPVAIWGVLRWYDFRGDPGVYILMDAHRHGALHEAIVRIITGVFNWPIATQVFRNENLPILKILRRASVTVNVIFWLSLIGIVGINFRYVTLQLQIWLEELASEGRKSAWIVVPLFCVGSLAVPLLLDVPRRFGGGFFPFFVLCMIAITRYAPHVLVRNGALAMALFVGVAGALLIATDIQYLQPQMVHSWRLSRSYVEVLRASNEPVLFSVNDASAAWSSDNYVQQFAGYKGKLVRVNDLSWDASCPGLVNTSIQAERGGAVSVLSRITSRCGSHYFSTAFPPVDPPSRIFTRNLKEAQILYDLGPKASTSSDGTMWLRVRIKPQIVGSGLVVPLPAVDRESKTLLVHP